MWLPAEVTLGETPGIRLSMRTGKLISGPTELLFTIVPELDTQYTVVSRSRGNKINKCWWSALPRNVVL